MPATLQGEAVPALEKVLKTEPEIRVELEAAASAAALASSMGEQRIADILWADADAVEMSMEAILILTELKNGFAREQLCQVAGDARFLGDERRQAAIWGLGKAGLKSYSDLVPFVGDEEENVALHAIAAFGPDTPESVIDALVTTLVDGDDRHAAAASEALRIIGSVTVLKSLVSAAGMERERNDWLWATLGRLSPDMVRTELRGTLLLERLQPMLLLAHGANWLANEETVGDVAFLLKQAL